ncbi:MAG: type VI secretion lipoprotein TssJ [Candidatus Adiutrix sp.]|jgi:hypothetical protein|nr:type VI secretion lipoprotein TssJ [Candidatus Adiutrix sp.]
MRRLLDIARPAIILLALAGLSACSGKAPAGSQTPPEDQHAESPDKVVWNLYPRGLTVNLSAGGELNPYGGQSNAVMICLYQLNGAASFGALAGLPEGLSTLLGCGKFDPSAISAKRLFLQPGGKSSEVFDRLEGVSAVGLAVGYMTPNPGGSTCQAAFPLRKTMVGLPFFKHAEYTPEPLVLDVRLGAEAMTCRPRAPGDSDPYPAPAEPPPPAEARSPRSGETPSPEPSTETSNPKGPQRP